MKLIVGYIHEYTHEVLDIFSCIKELTFPEFFYATITSQILEAFVDLSKSLWNTVCKMFPENLRKQEFMCEL